MFQGQPHLAQGGDLHQQGAEEHPEDRELLEQVGLEQPRRIGHLLQAGQVGHVTPLLLLGQRGRLGLDHPLQRLGVGVGGELEPQQSQAGQDVLEGLRVLGPVHGQVAADLLEPGAIHGAVDVLQDRPEALLGLGRAAGDVGALGQLGVEGLGQLRIALPAFGADQVGAGLQVGPGRDEGRRPLGAPTGDQALPGQGVALGGIQQVHAGAQVADDVEDPLVRLGPVPEQAADAQVEGTRLALPDQREGRLLHPVVEEPVADLTGIDLHPSPVHSGGGQGGPPRRDDDTLLDRGPEDLLGLGGGGLGHGRQHAQPHRAAHHRRPLEHLEGRLRQPPELGHHQVHHVLRALHRPDAIRVVPPAAVGMLEAEVPHLLEGLEELDQEEGVAPGLLHQQLGEAAGGVLVAAQGVADDLAHRSPVQRCNRDLGRGHVPLAQLLEGQRQRVGGAHLVIAIGPHEQQAQVRRRADQVAHELEGGRVRPLQIVQEDHQRTIPAGEHPQEAGDDRLEADLGLGRGQLLDRRLGPEDQPEFGDQVDHEAGVLTQRLGQPPGPVLDPLGALGQDRSQQLAERLGEGVEGEVPLQGIVLAHREEPLPLGDRPVELADEGGLPDPRVPRDQRQLELPAGRSLEAALQPRQLRVPPVELLWNPDPLVEVARSELEVGDDPVALQHSSAGAQVVQDAGGALVAVLGVLGHQPLDDAADRGREIRSLPDEGLGLPGDVGVDQLHRVGELERRPAHQHRVQASAEGVVVRSVVHRPVHPPRLFRRDVLQPSLDPARLDARAHLPGYERRVAVAEQGHLARLQVDQGVARVDVPVDHPGLVQLADSFGEADGDPQGVRQGQPAVRDQLLEGPSADVVGEQGGPAVGPGGTGGQQLAPPPRQPHDLRLVLARVPGAGQEHRPAVVAADPRDGRPGPLEQGLEDLQIPRATKIARHTRPPGCEFVGCGENVPGREGTTSGPPPATPAGQWRDAVRRS